MKTNERQLISINIKEENGKQTVSARELHEKLGIESKFMDWFNRMLKYGFEESVDYVAIAQKKETAQGMGKVVEGVALNALKGGLTIQELIRSGNVEAIKELMKTRR